MLTEEIDRAHTSRVFTGNFYLISRILFVVALIERKEPHLSFSYQIELHNLWLGS